jgi:cation/acetate symporter
VAIGWTITTGPEGGWTGALLANPAMWATPLAITTAVLVSLATPSRIPAGTRRTMVRLHTPERVALARSRVRD